MRYGAVIVAAGMSTRMKQFKQLMKIGEMSLAERVIVNFRRAGVKDIVMVTGFNADENLNCSYNVGGRAYLPEEMAEVAAFLLSDASGCISGQIITCNNGNTVNARWK